MNISEEQLRKLMLRALKELEAEKKEESGNRQTLYMVCGSSWKDEYGRFLEETEISDAYDIYPVVPVSWKKQGYEERLRSFKACAGIIYRSRCGKPADLGCALSLFPVVSRDLLVKTALGISDTFETSWIADCIEKGSRMVFLRSGLAKFSGKEKPAYINRIMEYCRQILEYGIEICGPEELFENVEEKPSCFTGHVIKPDNGKISSEAPVLRRKRVISAANVEQFVFGGKLYLQPGDIVTDLAKDRAKSLNIVFK